MSGKTTYFRLQKLYLDCIDDRGNCFIIYRTRLDLFFFRIYYSSTIYSDQKGEITEISSTRKTGEPIINDFLLFYNHFLETKGTWKRTDTALPPFIYRDKNDNELTWNCHHPKALAEIIYEDQTFHGYGYAETLSMTIKPWNLPIDELRWGRFLSEDYTITWIKWKGEQQLNKLFINGKEYNDSVFESGKVIFGDGDFELVFNEILTIKKEKLSSIFSDMPWIRLFIKRGTLESVENKYKARSALYSKSKLTARGWSLYEIVQWKK